MNNDQKKTQTPEQIFEGNATNQMSIQERMSLFNEQKKQIDEQGQKINLLLSNPKEEPLPPKNIFNTISDLKEMAGIYQDQQKTPIQLTPEEQESYDVRKQIAKENNYETESPLQYKYGELTSPKRINVNDVQQADEYFQDENGQWKIRKGRVIAFGSGQGVGDTNSFLNNYHSFLQQQHLQNQLTDFEKEEEGFRRDRYEQDALDNIKKIGKNKASFLSEHVWNFIRDRYSNNDEKLTEDEYSKAIKEQPELQRVSFNPNMSKKMFADLKEDVKRRQELRSQNPLLYDKLEERQNGDDNILGGIKADGLSGIIDRRNLPSWRVLKAAAGDLGIYGGVGLGMMALAGAPFTAMGALTYMGYASFGMTMLPAMWEVGKYAINNGLAIASDGYNHDDFVSKAVVASEEMKKSSDTFAKSSRNIVESGVGIGLVKVGLVLGEFAKKSPNIVAKVVGYLSATGVGILGAGLDLRAVAGEGGAEELLSQQLAEINPNLNLSTPYEAIHGMMGGYFNTFNQSTTSPAMKELDNIITATGFAAVGGLVIGGGIKGAAKVWEGGKKGVSKAYNFTTGAGAKNATNPLNYVNNPTLKEKQQIADILNTETYTDVLNEARKVEIKKDLAENHSESPLDKGVSDARIIVDNLKQTGSMVDPELQNIASKNKSHEINIPTSDGMQTNISMPFYREVGGKIEHVIYEQKTLSNAIMDNKPVKSRASDQEIYRYGQNLWELNNHLNTFIKESEPLLKSKKDFLLDTKVLRDKLKKEQTELSVMGSNNQYSINDILNKKNILQELEADIELAKYKPYNLIEDEDFYKTMFLDHDTVHGQAMIEALSSHTELYKTYRDIAMQLGKELEDGEILTIKPSGINPYYLKSMEHKHSIDQLNDKIKTIQDGLFEPEFVKQFEDFTSLLKKRIEAEHEYAVWKTLEAEKSLPVKKIEEILGKNEDELLNNISNAEKNLEDYAKTKQKEMEDLINTKENLDKINEAKKVEEVIDNIKKTEETKKSIFDSIAAYNACVRG